MIRHVTPNYPKVSIKARTFFGQSFIDVALEVPEILREHKVCPPPLKVILEYIHMRPKVKSNWSEFTSVHGVFFICVHMNFILLWVVFHFSEIDRSEVFKPVWDCMWTHFYLKWIFYPKWNETLKKFTRPI